MKSQEKSFDKKLFTAYGRNKSFHQIIKGNRILKSKVARKNNEPQTIRKTLTCISRLSNLYCKTVKQTKVKFQKSQNKSSL